MCPGIRSHRLAVRTSDSHSGNTGSIPVGTAKNQNTALSGVFLLDFQYFHKFESLVLKTITVLPIYELLIDNQNIFCIINQ